MSDISIIFARDPLLYTKDAGEVEKVIAAMREMRHTFNTTGMATKKASPKQKESADAAGLSLKDIGL